MVFLKMVAAHWFSRVILLQASAVASVDRYNSNRVHDGVHHNSYKGL